MRAITLISTMHDEIGNCNAEELCKIIKEICPEVIFLEALESNYSEYEKQLFENFEVYHKKLEIKAIQLYSQINSFVYVPVLESGLNDSFENKFKFFENNSLHRRLIDNYNVKVNNDGFRFLNSIESIKLQEEMRKFESSEFNYNEIEIEFNDSMDKYENSMLNNIYSFSKNNSFNTAIFMCGVAHRKSIIDKTELFQKSEEIKLNWNFYE